MTTTWKSSRQYEVFQLIRDEVAATGRMPSTTFIADAMNFSSTSRVREVLETLALSGRLIPRTALMSDGRRRRITYDLAPAHGGRALDRVAHRGAP